MMAATRAAAFLGVARDRAAVARMSACAFAAAFGLAACAQACVPLAVWSVPVEGGVREIPAPEVFAQARSRPVVLLGESHDVAEHHRWQLHTLAALHAQHPAMAIGFEMFPRRVQPVLDQWVAGELTEAQFLERVHWSQVWGFDAALYLPLFHYARMHRLPMLALNVERQLVRRVGREGWDAVPESEREGVGRPEPAGPEYLRELHAAYVQHGGERSPDLDDPAFRRFVAGQLTWDRAMAEAIWRERQRYPDRQVVAIMGRGHAEPGAVPHQLRALGIAQSLVLLPWDRTPACASPEQGRADAVFGVAVRDEMRDESGPRLGIALAPGQGPGARIEGIEAGSVAAASGLRVGDVLVEIAGRQVRGNDDVVAAIRRQPPGTWLPMRVRRDDAELDVVARFPAR
jgi:uncharacterized iron-regulated protein